MRFMGKTVQGTSVLLGAMLAMGACVLPVVSSIVSPVISSIREKVGGTIDKVGA